MAGRGTDNSSSGKGATPGGRSKLRGWIAIAVVAIAILVFVVLGTMDADLRYDLIGV